MNLIHAILQQNIVAIHYTQKDSYLDKQLKSYTGKEVFTSIEDANKFLTRNGFNLHEGVKYDMSSQTGSVTTYAIMKQFELYSY